MRTHREPSREPSVKMNVQKVRPILTPTLTTAVLSVLAIFASASVSASEAEADYKRFEITPFAGYMAGGEFEDPTTNAERDLEEDTSFGLIVDIAAESWRHYEFLFANLDSEVDGTIPFDMGVQYLQIGGTVSHLDARHVIPYFGMTIGAARFSPDAAGLDDETKLAFSAGGGMRIPITDHFGVRFDARAFLTVLDSEGDLFCVSDGGAGTCAIRAKSDTFLQYAASLGVTFAF
jgi:hypothetical protein